MRVVVDADGLLTAEAYAAGVAELRARGLEVIASPVEHLPETGREIELVLPEVDLADADRLVQLCEAAFGKPVAAGVVTYISRGTDDDASGVLAAFDVRGAITRSVAGDTETVTVTLSRDDLDRVFEARLHTALEAALNCEVRIVAAAGAQPGDSTPPSRA